MDFLVTPITPASGTSVTQRRRSVAPERVHAALAPLENIMSAFEIGAPEPSAAPSPGRAFNHEPSWAPTPGMSM